MGTISQWWEERLKAHDPIGVPAVHLDGYNLKMHPTSQEPWPKAVARSALYEDYRFWFEDRAIKPIMKSPNYDPKMLPITKTEHEFFICMKPWIYIDKDHQVKNYWVWGQRQHEGEWVKVKVRRWFVRLMPWEAHAIAFFVDTGIDTRLSAGKYNPT